jgi:hypothetical protein
MGAHHGGVEIERGALCIDHGRAGDAERRNVPTRERRARNRRSQRSLPHLRAAPRIERENFVVLSGDDQLAIARSRPTPKQRLRVNLALKSGTKIVVGPQIPCAFIGEAGHNVRPRAVECTVVGQDGLIGLPRSREKERDGD